MKLTLIIFMCAIAISAQAQTANELIGKWKLVKQTKKGVVKEPENTYQIFREGGQFEGIAEGKTGKGKWTLSEDNKELKVKIGIATAKFKVEYFDAQKRVISNDQLGTLEYEKVPE
ncbi:glycoside hydrolase family 43 C-terminal domain-containing protein [Chryseolinea sp. T2]|uniref:lipocalin-like domain-containing protein n=1 Tax=Chryseolinea sp. T2 TaxID=3129255 RepID=UPI00307866E4